MLGKERKMNKNEIQISGAEEEIMRVLWSADVPITAKDVCDTLKDKDWKYSTVATLFSRLEEKGAVTHEKRGRFFYYTPLISEEAYRAQQTENLISKLYNGSVKNLITALLSTNPIPKDDLEEIKIKFDL